MADLVLENGNGLASADAYASRAAVLAYWADRADTTFSTAAAEAQDAAIRRATQFLDVQWGDRFKGERLVEDQALEWPRVGVTTREGWAVEGVPPQVVKATAELAKIALDGPLAGAGAAAPAPSQASISSMKAGSVELTYATAAKSRLETDHADKFFLIAGLLRPILKGSGLNRGLAR